MRRIDDLPPSNIHLRSHDNKTKHGADDDDDEESDSDKHDRDDAPTHNPFRPVEPKQPLPDTVPLAQRVGDALAVFLRRALILKVSLSWPDDAAGDDAGAADKGKPDDEHNDDDNEPADDAATTSAAAGDGDLLHDHRNIASLCAALELPLIDALFDR